MIKEFQRVVFFVLIFGVFSVPLAAAEELFSFVGDVDFSKAVLSLTVDTQKKSTVALQAGRVSEHMFRFSFEAEHLALRSFDISTVLEGEIEILPWKTEQGLKGKIWSKYTLVNYKPVQELFGHFEIKKGTLFLHSLILGSLDCQGTIQFVAPYKIDLLIKLTSVQMKDFIHFFTKKKDESAQGYVDGEIKLGGVPGQMSVKGTLSSYNGVVKEKEYQSIILNLFGIYPVMRVADTVVAQPDGLTFSVTGDVDLRSPEGFSKQIKALTRKPLVYEKGENLEWTLKRVRDEDNAGTIEIKYLKRQGDDLSTLSEEDSDMFGFERRVEF